MSVKIGLWGASGSGKTSFLAALGLTINEKSGWLIKSRDARVREFLEISLHEFEYEKMFPTGTVSIGEPYPITLERTAEGSRRMFDQVATRMQGMFGWNATVPNLETLNLEIVDVPGELFRPGGKEQQGGEKSEEALPEFENLLRHFETCDALVFLYDPLLEPGIDNFSRFFPLVNRLIGRIQGTGRLPQELAICMTKFDDPQVFELALQRKVEMEIDPASPGFYRPKDPMRYFAAMARDEVKLQTWINTYFHPQRVSYYATSAVGFRVGPNGMMDPKNYNNTVVGVIDGKDDGRTRVIGSPRPIGVLEPLIHVATSVERRRAEQRREVRR